jgi:hypothetical protein
MHTLSTDDFNNIISNIPVKIGEIYTHYSNPNKYYKILNVALDEATEEPVIIYKSLQDPYICWCRSYKNWSEIVMHSGKYIPRFTLYSSIDN